MSRIFKTKTVFLVILTAVFIMQAVLLSACSNAAPPDETTGEPVDTVSEAPTIQTEDPTAEPDDAYEVPENVIYYNGEETIELPYEPRKGDVDIRKQAVSAELIQKIEDSHHFPFPFRNSVRRFSRQSGGGTSNQMPFHVPRFSPRRKK